MKKLIASVLINFLALMLIDYLSESINFSSTTSILALAAVITVLNATLRPLLQVLSLPASIATLGLFRFVINGVVLLLAFNLTEGAAINGLWSAIWISVALSVLTSLLEGLFNSK